MSVENHRNRYLQAVKDHGFFSVEAQDSFDEFMDQCELEKIEMTEEEKKRIIEDNKWYKPKFKGI